MAKHYQPTSVLRDRAKGFLNGRYGASIGILMLHTLFTFGINGVVNNIVSLLEKDGATSVGMHMFMFSLGTVVSFIASVFLGVFLSGVYLFYLKTGCGQYAITSDIFSGFRDGFGRSFQISLAAKGVPILGFSLFSIVLEFYLTTNDKNWLVVSIIMGIAAVAWGIITELGLLMSWLIMHDFPEYTAGEVIAASWNKMKGNRGRLFALEMSFIPFYLLGILSFGVAFIWITPYLLQSRTQFYLDLMNAKEVTYTWERTV